jgi:hypothetical protein
MGTSHIWNGFKELEPYGDATLVIPTNVFGDDHRVDVNLFHPFSTMWRSLSRVVSGLWILVFIPFVALLFRLLPIPVERARTIYSWILYSLSLASFVFYLSQLFQVPTGAFNAIENEWLRQWYGEMHRIAIPRFDGVFYWFTATVIGELLFFPPRPSFYTSVRWVYFKLHELRYVFALLYALAIALYFLGYSSFFAALSVFFFICFPLGAYLLFRVKDDPSEILQAISDRCTSNLKMPSLEFRTYRAHERLNKYVILTSPHTVCVDPKWQEGLDENEIAFGVAHICAVRALSRSKRMVFWCVDNQMVLCMVWVLLLGDTIKHLSGYRSFPFELGVMLLFVPFVYISSRYEHQADKDALSCTKNLDAALSYLRKRYGKTNESAAERCKKLIEYGRSIGLAPAKDEG